FSPGFRAVATALAVAWSAPAATRRRRAREGGAGRPAASVPRAAGPSRAPISAGSRRRRARGGFAKAYPSRLVPTTRGPAGAWATGPRLEAQDCADRAATLELVAIVA